MSEASAAQWLEAGGLVPLAAPLGADLPSDTVDARGYTHPALAGRVVVRLVPDAVARGVDTEMELLGFALSSHADDIARQRRRTLGFPGAALVLDLERARYALEVMREFKKHAKRVASKPGHARDGFDEIAGRLARQVPHFLPSFWEEVARTFATGGNLSYASQAFDKARTAEREFGLQVDEERRGEAFLEFALLGALTVKSLQAYGKELARLSGAGAAYDRMFTLAVRRTLGGMPPWASLPKDLRSLAKAAKKDVAAEDERFLAEVLTAGSLQRAPASFWTEYRDAWKRLAEARPEVRARLLDLFPNGGKPRYSWRKDESGFDDAWTELLVETGALPVLWDAAVPAGAVPSGGRAAWLRRLQDWAAVGDGWTLQIVRRAADVLRAEGVPVKVRPGDWYKPLDLDLVELLLELDLAWTFDQGGAGRVQLDKWSGHAPAPARLGFAAELRPRDPERAAAHPDIAPHLVQAVDAVYGNAAFESVAAGMKGLAAVRRRWLEDRVADLQRTGLATSALGLARLEGATSADHFAEFPEALPALAEASIARSLARTLALGVFEELAWPAWDLAVDRLGLDKVERCHVHRQLPRLVLATNRKLVVLGRDGIELEHDLKHGHGDNVPQTTLVVGGEVLVQWQYWASGRTVAAAYWTGAPADTFDGAGAWQAGLATPIDAGDAVVYGVTRVSRRDRVSPPQLQFQAHDATGSWVLDEGELFVQDRATGKALEKGRPAFLEGVHWSPSDWAYYRVDAPGSPLGVVDGQYGARWLRPKEEPAEPEAEDDDEGVGELTLETLAGERWTGSMRLGGERPMPTAMVRWPGADRARPVHEGSSHWRKPHETAIVAGDPDGADAALASTEALRLGTRPLPPLAFWHFLTPVDEAGSRRLRRVDEADAARLLAAARRDDAALDAALGEVLPEVGAERLKAGLRHVIRFAADLEQRLEKLRDARRGGKARRATTGAEVSDEALIPAARHLRRYWTWGVSPSATAAARTLGRFLAEGETGEPIVHSRLEIAEWLGRIRAVCWGAARAGLTDADRRAFAAFARAWAESGLAEGEPLRVGRLSIETLDHDWILTTKHEDDGALTPADSWRHVSAGRRMFLWDVGNDEDGPWPAAVVERAPTYGDLPGATFTEARVARVEGDRAWLLAFADELERRGARGPSPEAADRFAEAVGVSRTEAALVLEGLPEQLDKEVREAYGLKAAEVKTAATRLFATPAEAKLELFAALATDDPASIWAAPDVDALARAWLARHGRSVAVDDALVTRADRELGGRPGGKVVKGFANPGSWAAITSDATWALDDEGVPRTEGEAFTADTVRQVVEGAAWITSRTPVGDPLRAAVPGVVATAAQRLASAGLWIHGLGVHLYEERTRKAADAWFAALPVRADVVARDDAGEERITRKVVGAVTVTRSTWRMNVAWQQAALDGHARELVVGAARLADQEPTALHALDALASPAFRRLLDRIERTPVPAGAWEQDPARSAPEVVAEVAAEEGLSPEAATLWLQLLTLLDPTKKDCIAWNGWKPPTYAAAVAELLARGLVVEGKRARAGREHFLPGGWVEATGILPYEEWKRPLYGWDERTGSFPVGRPVPLAPLHELFAGAWKRCVDEDRPRFEEVRR